MNVSLVGKKVFVTGITGAIGGAIAQALREAGAWVAGTYHQDVAAAQALQKQGIQTLQADLRDPTQARAVVEQVLQESGHLDAVVYAAGNTRDRTLSKLTDADWNEVMDLHVKGLFAIVSAVLPGMRARGSGKIAAIGSLSGSIGRVGQANYSAAKAATIGLIKSTAKETGRFGVTANVVCPGFIDSKMTRAAPPAAWERAKAASALGQISSVEVIASFMVWLCSDLCQGVTGQVFQLDSRI